MVVAGLHHFPVAIGARFRSNTEGVPTHANPADFLHRGLHFRHVATQAVQSFLRMRRMGKTFQSLGVAGAAHLIRLVLAQFHAMHFMAIKAADVFLAMRADTPLTVGNGVTPLANFGGDR